MQYHSAEEEKLFCIARRSGLTFVRRLPRPEAG